MWELSPVSANGVVAQRFHMHSRLICGMCEDHLACRDRASARLSPEDANHHTHTIIIYLKLKPFPPLAYLYFIARSGKTFSLIRNRTVYEVLQNLNNEAADRIVLLSQRTC